MFFVKHTIFAQGRTIRMHTVKYITRGSSSATDCICNAGYWKYSVLCDIVLLITTVREVIHAILAKEIARHQWAARVMRRASVIEASKK